MDESGSINDDDFTKEQDFIVDLANGFTNFGPNGLQMGVISYSTDAYLDIKLNQFSNKMQFIKAVRQIKQFSKIHFQLIITVHREVTAVAVTYGCLL